MIARKTKVCDILKAIGQPVLGVKEKLLEINSNLFFRRLEVHEKAKLFILQMNDVIRDVYWKASICRSRSHQ